MSKTEKKFQRQSRGGMWTSITTPSLRIASNSWTVFCSALGSTSWNTTKVQSKNSWTMFPNQSLKKSKNLLYLFLQTIEFIRTHLSKCQVFPCLIENGKKVQEFKNHTELDGLLFFLKDFAFLGNTLPDF